MIGLIDLATVYTPHATTGDFTVVDRAALACRLALVTVIGTDTGPGRAELAEERRLLWGPEYTMPETAQLLIAGRRWNVQAGTMAAVRGVSGEVEYQRARVVEAS